MSTSAIIFSDNAAKKVYELICEENNFELKLRVYIQGGGCSGFSYGFAFEEKVNEGDTVIEKKLQKEDDQDEGGSGSGTGLVRLVVDPISFQYLMGAEIDYRDDEKGAHFVIRNPNAKTTCGCGSSFSV